MVFAPSKYDPDKDIAEVEQSAGFSISEVLATGIVPPVVNAENYVELEHDSVIGRPEDVFDALSMQKKINKAAKAAADKAVAESAAPASAE